MPAGANVGVDAVNAQAAGAGRARTRTAQLGGD
jgi:hypothetical protein